MSEINDDVRKIVREELERQKRIESGDKWVDGCKNCGAPTHGTLERCPYPLVLGLCGHDKSNYVFISHGNTNVIVCCECRSWKIQVAETKPNE